MAMRPVGSLSRLMAELKRGTESVCVVDVRPATPQAVSFDELRRLHEHCPRSAVLAVVDRQRPEDVSRALEHGAFDVLAPPLTSSDLAAAVDNAHEFQRLAAASAEEAVETHRTNGVVAVSPVMRRLLALLPKLGAAQCHVLLAGEVGTGRETLARLLHKAGRRARSRFVHLDGATARASELEGAVVAAGGGTVYLTHLDEMPLPRQAALMRALGQVGDVGQPDVRMIAAVDPQVTAQVDAGKVGRALFELISLARLDVPPLRERRTDVPLLARHLLAEICARDNIDRKTITRPALTLLERLPWRRNLLELRGLLERLALFVPGGLIRLEDVLEHVNLDHRDTVAPTGGTSLREAREQFEREYIAATLRRHRGRMPEAARALGMQRTNLYRKLRVLKVSRQGV